MVGVLSGSRARLGAVLSVVLLTGAGLVPVVAQRAEAVEPCGTTGNRIVCENAKAGADDWDISGAGDESIQGFATEISTNVGGRVDFKIDTDAAAYAIDIYRIGYYQGKGARKVASVAPSADLPQQQPACITDASTEIYDCGLWGVSASWNVPSDAISGVYVAKLTRADDGGASHITFVVRDDASRSDIVFQTSDTTWQAYNTYGGSDFYQGGAHGRAYKVSYNRPVMTRDDNDGRDFFFSAEYALVRFLERNGYDTSYISGVDTDRRGSLLRNHKVFLSVGHDEYWSGQQRANVEAARDAGVHLQFLSGNEMYWKTRYENSVDPSATPYRTLVSYKETWADAKIDPDSAWTGTWRDPRHASTANGGGRPENALIGTAYMVNHDDLAIKVSAAEGKYRLWRNTTLASMTSGTATLAPHTIGYESNEDIDNGHRPPGLVRLSTTTGAVPEYLQDFGNTVAPGTTTHNLTLYKAPSGALVFSAGSVQWTWGLDEEHDSSWAPEPADVRMQQAQVNLFADMDVQPLSLISTLKRSTKSTDKAGPVVTILSPSSLTSQKNGDRVTVSGTAYDLSGKVAGIEASTDGGATWHPATGTTSWSYSFIQGGSGSTVFRVRGVDDSANIGNTATRTYTVKCPCSIYGATTPVIASVDGTDPVELGLRFTPTRDGVVTGVRFYKGTGNSGTHTGSLWSASGQRLAQVTFTGETASGWQSATFAEGVSVTGGHTYTVSYSAPQGRYAAERGAFYSRGVDTTLLQVAGGFGTQPAGVYGTLGTLPTQSYQRTQYYVDPLFLTHDEAPLGVKAPQPAVDASTVPVDTRITATYTKAVTASSVQIKVVDSAGNTVTGTTAYNSTTRTATFTPSQPLAAFVVHTVTVKGTASSGGAAVASGGTWSFRTARPTNPDGVCPCSLYDEDDLPAVLDGADASSVDLGTRFTSEVDGKVTGVRFYKGPANTGTHTGSLWSASGIELARGTFAGETSSGWQELLFATPVSITKNTAYVVSYKAPGGHYSVSPNAFLNADLSRSPLAVTSTAGAYTYTGGFPDQATPTSYLVDPIFERNPPTIEVESRTPVQGGLNIPRSGPVRVEFSAPITSGWSLTARNGSTVLAGSTSLSGGAKVLTWSPSSTLPAGTTITMTLSGVRGTSGAELPTSTWRFTTRSNATKQSQTLFGDQTPQTQASDDAVAVEVGVAFTPAVDGEITAVRFHKGTGNTGTHTGSVWSTDGVRLATVTFEDETESGWQTARLATPLQVRAGDSYVVSYLAPHGHYSATTGFFDQTWTRDDLSAPSTGNGRYVYGGGFPAFTYGAANYFVDVVFEAAEPTLDVATTTPAAGTDEAALSSRPSVRFTDALAPGWQMTVQSGGSSVPGVVEQSSDARTLTFVPSGPLAADTAHTVTVTGLTSVAGATLGTQTWAFRTTQATSGEVTLFGNTTPATTATADGDAIEVGTAFTTAQAGQITGVRFYKGPGNTGTHVGSLWSESGERLAQVTFTGETAEGWQTATFDTPVEAVAGGSYVVSYYAPQGHYASQGAFFTSPHVSGPLTAPSGENGRYRYGAGGGLPTSSWNSTNYFVDAVFTPTH